MNIFYFLPSGGELFGYSEDKPDEMANTLLAIMVKCFFTKKKYVISLIPVHALNSANLYAYINGALELMHKCGGLVVALINDNNRVNQSFFGMFRPLNEDKPWIVHSPFNPDVPLYLMYDSVHLLKNIRNNWITEKTKILSFFDAEGQEKMAHWSSLKELYFHESTSCLMTNSKLTYKTIFPNNLEKQKVSLVTDVFSDRTVTALLTSEKTHSSPEAASTAEFLQLVSELWKILNCKRLYEKDPKKSPLSHTAQGQSAALVLKKWAARSHLPLPKTVQRQKSLTKDTASALSWTCNCLLDLADHLLSTNQPYRHQWVSCGFFQQDDLESHFGHFRMAAGCNFFITTKDVFATHTIDRAKSMLASFSNDEISSIPSSHQCALCSKKLTEEEMLLLDEMPSMTHTHDDKLALFYVAGYIASKDQRLSASKDSLVDGDSEFIDELNRGGLSYPSTELYKLTSLAALFFFKTPEKLCRVRFINIVMDFLCIFEIDIYVKKDNLTRLCNILMKRFSLNNVQNTVHLGKKKKEKNAQRKAAKLQSGKK